MSKELTNPLYLFGILEESNNLKDWKNKAPQEYHEYRKAWMTRTERHEHGEFPLSLNIEVTRKCNLACTFCWHRELDEDLKIDMTMEQFKAVVDEASKYSLPAINLNGLGEPMMNPNLPEMIRYCKDAGIQEVMFHTNATIMNEKIAEDLIESGLDIIIFSLDSPDKDTYEAMRVNAKFDAVQRNVETFLSAKKSKGTVKPFVRVTMVLTEKTAEQVPTFVDRWSGKVDSITVQDLLFAANSDVGSDDPDKFKGSENSRLSISAKELKDYEDMTGTSFICPYLFQSLKVHPSGSISSCSPQEAPNVGSISDGLHAIWHGERMNSLRKKHLEGNWRDVPECNRCDIPYMELARDIERVRQA